MGIQYKKQFVKSDGRKLNRTGPRDMQARASGDNYVPDNNMMMMLLTNQITELKSEVMSLKSQPDSAVPSGFFSPEQVDEEIRKAVESAVAETAISFKSSSDKNSDLLPLVKEYKSQIVALQKGNDDLTRLHAAIVKENSFLKENVQGLESDLVDAVDLKEQLAVLDQELSGKQEMIEMLKSRPAIVGNEIIDPERPQMEQIFVDPLEDDAGEGLKPNINIETFTKDEEVDDKVDKLRNLLGKLPKRGD